MSHWSEEPVTDRELAHQELDAEELAEVYETRGWARLDRAQTRERAS